MRKWSRKYDKLIASFTDTRGTLDVAIPKIRETCMQSCAIDLRLAIRLGYLDVAIAKNSQNSQIICRTFATIFAKLIASDGSESILSV